MTATSSQVGDQRRLALASTIPDGPPVAAFPIGASQAPATGSGVAVLAKLARTSLVETTLQVLATPRTSTAVGADAVALAPKEGPVPTEPSLVASPAKISGAAALLLVAAITPAILPVLRGVVTLALVRLAPSAAWQLEVEYPALELRAEVRRLEAVAARPHEQCLAVIHVVVPTVKLPERLALAMPTPRRPDDVPVQGPIQAVTLLAGRPRPRPFVAALRLLTLPSREARRSPTAPEPSSTRAAVLAALALTPSLGDPTRSGLATGAKEVPLGLVGAMCRPTNVVRSSRPVIA